jgi:hypothetical protein
MLKKAKIRLLTRAAQKRHPIPKRDREGVGAQGLFSSLLKRFAF